MPKPKGEKKPVGADTVKVKATTDKSEPKTETRRPGSKDKPMTAKRNTRWPNKLGGGKKLLPKTKKP